MHKKIYSSSPLSNKRQLLATQKHIKEGKHEGGSVKTLVPFNRIL